MPFPTVLAPIFLTLFERRIEGGLTGAVKGKAPR